MPAGFEWGLPWPEDPRAPESPIAEDAGTYIWDVPATPSRLHLQIVDIPANKNYPHDAVQCDDCGGHGCATCDGDGWLPFGDPNGRECERGLCENPIPPSQVAIYCSNECALEDA